MTQLEQAREIAIAVATAPHVDAFVTPSWLLGWTKACRAGECDMDDEVRGPLVALRMASGQTLAEAVSA